MELKITDRYDALGIPLPDPATICEGMCEGTGAVPIQNPFWHKGHTSTQLCSVVEDWEQWKVLWLEAEKKEPTDDSWHFVKCPDCDGTGKRKCSTVQNTQRLAQTGEKIKSTKSPDSP